MKLQIFTDCYNKFFIGSVDGLLTFDQKLSRLLTEMSMNSFYPELLNPHELTETEITVNEATYKIILNLEIDSLKDLSNVKEFIEVYLPEYAL